MNSSIAATRSYAILATLVICVLWAIAVKGTLRPFSTASAGLTNDDMRTYIMAVAALIASFALWVSLRNLNESINANTKKIMFDSSKWFLEMMTSDEFKAAQSKLHTIVHLKERSFAALTDDEIQVIKKVSFTYNRVGLLIVRDIIDRFTYYHMFAERTYEDFMRLKEWILYVRSSEPGHSRFQQNFFDIAEESRQFLKQHNILESIQTWPKKEPKSR